MTPLEFAGSMALAVFGGLSIGCVVLVGGLFGYYCYQRWREGNL